MNPLMSKPTVLQAVNIQHDQAISKLKQTRLTIKHEYLSELV